jgi:hypothetical protein
MTVKRSNRCVVVVMYWVLRGARRVRVTCVSPTRRTAQALVRALGGEREDAVVIAAHVVLAAASTGAIALAAAYVGGGASELADLVGAVAVGAIAVSVAVVLVRRRMGRGRVIQVRPLIAAAAAKVDARHLHLPAIRALHFMCEPERLWSQPTAALPRAARYLARRVVKEFALRPAKSMLPVVGSVMSVASACQDTVDNARFVQAFALTAVDVCRELAA